MYSCFLFSILQIHSLPTNESFFYLLMHSKIIFLVHSGLLLLWCLSFCTLSLHAVTSILFFYKHTRNLQCITSIFQTQPSSSLTIAYCLLMYFSLQSFPSFLAVHIHSAMINSKFWKKLAHPRTIFLQFVHTFLSIFHPQPHDWLNLPASLLWSSPEHVHSMQHANTCTYGLLHWSIDF